MKFASLVSLILTCLILFSSSSAQAANYNCLVTSSADSTNEAQVKPGMLRYYLQKTMALEADQANCPPPSQAGDSKLTDVNGEKIFDQIVVFNTKEFTGDAANLNSVTLQGQIDLSSLKSNVVVGNWGPEMLTDTSSDVQYPSDYAVGLQNYGTIFIDARTNLDEGTSPFKCESTSSSLYLRNVIIWSYLTWEEMKAQSPCLKSAGAVYVCSGKSINSNPISSSQDTVPDSFSSSTDEGGLVAAPLTDLNNSPGRRKTKSLVHKGSTRKSSKGTESSPLSTPSGNQSAPWQDGDGESTDNGSDNGNGGVTWDDHTDKPRVGGTPVTGNDGTGGNDTPTAWCEGSTTVPDEETPTQETSCSDGVDNDKDGKTDCEDTSDCSADQACQSTNKTDADGDGFDAEDEDCNDSDAAIHPGATEVCDNIDNDCDGTIDNDFIETSGDADDDGVLDCADTESSGDDTTSCGDGIDNDGDGLIDSSDTGCPSEDNPDDEVAVENCSNGVDDTADGYVDCNDSDCTNSSACPAPGSDRSDDLTDDDGDGFYSEEDDCDDANALINPSKTEICGDAVDNDCDSQTTDDSADETCTPSTSVSVDGGSGAADTASGGCGCNLTSTTAPAVTQLAQMLLAAIPLGASLILRKRAQS